jgi:hypothetical protein
MASVSKWNAIRLARKPMTPSDAPMSHRGNGFRRKHQTSAGEPFPEEAVNLLDSA